MRTTLLSAADPFPAIAASIPAAGPTGQAVAVDTLRASTGYRPRRSAPLAIEAQSIGGSLPCRRSTGVRPSARGQMSFLRSLACVVASTIALAAGCSSDSGDDDDGGGDGELCLVGLEGCPCYEDMSCDGDHLTCASKICVDLGGIGGSGATGGSGVGGSTGGTAGTAMGGSAGSATGGSGATATGGQGGTTGGSTGTGGTTAGGGGMPGGSGGTAGGRAGAGGASGASGSGGMCTADTQTDPNNCGECGHVCRNQDGVFQGRGCNEAAGTCCADGACGNFLSDCVAETMGFTTCSEVCASIGEQCVQRGCGNTTWREWDDSDTSCETFGATIGSGIDTCETNLWDADIKVRCCCTDTQ